MFIKSTSILLPEICGTVFVVLYRDEIRIWIIIKIMLNEENPDYTVKMLLKMYERIEEYYKRTLSTL